MIPRRCYRCQRVVWGPWLGSFDDGAAPETCRCLQDSGLRDGYTIEEGNAPLGHHHSYRNEDGFLCSSYRTDVECVEDVYETFLERTNACVTCFYCGKQSRSGHNAEQVARWFVSHACAGTREELP